MNDISWFDIISLSIYPIIGWALGYAETQKYQRALHFARTNEAWRNKPRPD